MQIDEEEMRQLIMVITTKRDYIAQIKKSLSVLRTLKRELADHLHNCKISNTVGNATNIVGSVMLFTPLYLLGVGLLIAGASTSVGTTVVEASIEGGKKKRIENVLKEEEKAFKLYIGCAALFKGAIQVGYLALSTGRQVKVIQKFQLVREILSTFEAIKAVEPAAQVSFQAAKTSTEIAKVCSRYLIALRERLNHTHHILDWESSLEVVENMGRIWRLSKRL
jgi:hypothetical protein